MRRLLTHAPGVIGILLAASPLLAHHAWPVDRTTEITITGTVTGYSWADPHVTIALDVEATGTIEKWKVGGSNKKNMAVNGWDKHTLKPGDVITGIGFRYRDRSHAAQLRKIVLPSGKEMDLYGGLAAHPADFSAFEGRWVADLAASQLHSGVQVRSIGLAFGIGGDRVRITDNVVSTAGKQIGQGTIEFITDDRDHPLDRVVPGMVARARWAGPRRLETVFTRRSGVVERVNYEVSADGTTLTNTTEGPLGLQRVIFRRPR
ncbi:MAG: hypothetical protein EHM55_25845 [Acidobacteria bacterium]|nr:MAG: hypothetical protein EHM55_25845 [Acidobacteriota bacterium]